MGPTFKMNSLPLGYFALSLPLFPLLIFSLSDHYRAITSPTALHYFTAHLSLSLAYPHCFSLLQLLLATTHSIYFRMSTPPVVDLDRELVYLWPSQSQPHGEQLGDYNLQEGNSQVSFPLSDSLLYFSLSLETIFFRRIFHQQIY